MYEVGETVHWAKLNDGPHAYIEICHGHVVSCGELTTAIATSDGRGQFIAFIPTGKLYSSYENADKANNFV